MTVAQLALVLAAICFSYPFIVQVTTSFKSDADATARPLSPWPQPFSLEAWSTVFTGGSEPVSRWFLTSLGVSLVVTAGRVAFDSLAGYALARLRFPGRRLVFAGVLAVLAVPGVVLLIPKFLLVTQLGIYDTYAAMVLPLLVDATGIFIMKQFFESVPRSVEEAARLDGAGIFRTFWSIILPMSRPALLALTMLSFQSSWNEFSHFLAVTRSPEYHTMVTGLAALSAGGLGEGSMFPLKMAAALATMLPVLLLFVLLQRHLVGVREHAD